MWTAWLERILGARDRHDDRVLRAGRAGRTDNRREHRPPSERVRSPVAERSEADSCDLLTIEDRADVGAQD